jgi:hypothetical protein
LYFYLVNSQFLIVLLKERRKKIDSWVPSGGDGDGDGDG